MLQTQKKVETNKVVQAVLDYIPNSVVVLDEKGIIKYTNDIWRTTAQKNGLDPGQSGPGVNYLQIIEKAVEAGSKSAARVAAGIKAVMAGRQEEFTHDYPCHSADQKRWFKMIARSAQGGIIISHIDITGQQNQIQYMTTHDALTGLYNRTKMEEKIKQLDERKNIPLSVIMVDVNGLGKINHIHGSDRGDEILKATANLLLALTTSEHTVGRWGEDEFIVLLPRVKRSSAELLNKKIKNVSKTYKVGGTVISLSTGVATKKFWKEEVMTMIKLAVENMNRDKILNSNSDKYNNIAGLLSTLAAKSDETEAHSVRMEDLAVRFGEALGLNSNSLNELIMLAHLHDIGKVRIDRSILNKPGRLNDKEWELIREHPLIGYKIAKSLDDFSSIAEYILTHHERWDGSGYPQGLKGAEIPYLARIIALIDAYDVMTNERAYKSAYSPAEALAEIKSGAGAQFDPELAEKFIQLIEDKSEIKK